MRWRSFLTGAALVAAAFAVRGGVRRPEVPELAGGRPIRVEVLNGSAIPKAGLGLAEVLRRRGFDVVSIGNADRSDYDRTLVLDRVGRLDYARAVAEELGVDPAFRQKNEDLLLEVTVILGKDRADRYSPRPGGEDP
jgi:LytR cell envelope-related transcriptional attenuator